MTTPSRYPKGDNCKFPSRDCQVSQTWKAWVVCFRNILAQQVGYFHTFFTSIAKIVMEAFFYLVKKISVDWFIFPQIQYLMSEMNKIRAVLRIVQVYAQALDDLTVST